jgi:hypothetical protein
MKIHAGARVALIGIGGLFLAIAVVLFLLSAAGLIENPGSLVLGQSRVRTLASLAVMGCLALAAGFWDK